MRKKYNIKARLSGALAAVMVITMAAPGLPAYAAGSYGDASKIVFDPDIGPGIGLSNYGKQDDGGNGEFTASGQMGHLLTTAPQFTGIGTLAVGSGPRPVIPSFSSGIWPGYTFVHWVDKDGTELTRLPYAFPYEPSTTYKAVWKGDDTLTYPFRVEHFRVLTGSEDWPSAEDYNAPDKIRSFYTPQWDQAPQKANTTVSATYRRDIPGYKLGSVLIKNNLLLNYSKKPVKDKENKLVETAGINETTHAVKGYMPNDSLTVAYRYVPDESKKFTITVNSVTEDERMEDGTPVIVTNPIGQPQIYTNYVEQPYNILPPEIDFYEIDVAKTPEAVGSVSGSVSSEDMNSLSQRGVVTVSQAGYTYNSENHSITGTMPNQNITVTYTYHVKADVQTRIFVTSKDEKGNPFHDSQTHPVSIGPLTPQAPVDVPITEFPGYTYPPYVSWKGDLSNVEDRMGTEKKFVMTPGIAGGTVTSVYNENHADTDYWAKLEFYSGLNGGFTAENFNSTQFIKRNLGEALPGVRVGDLTDLMQPEGNEHYIFEGWYKTLNGTAKTGSMLGDDERLSADTRLYADFIEKPGDWVDIRFAAGPHGSLNGTVSFHTLKNTPWSGVSAPVPVADSNKFRFDNWYREDGSMVTALTELYSGSQTYTARFVPTYDPITLPVSPDARGAIGSDGMGEIGISGANVKRDYALTDKDGRVKEVKSGLELNNSKFTQLKPCAVYKVYELIDTLNPALGASLPDGIDENNISLPTLVTIPALGDNYSVGAAPGGGMELKITPAAPGTVYGVLNDEGQVVNAEADGGWVTPDSSGAVIRGLMEKQLYVVVARRAGEEADAADKRLLGTQIFIPAASEESRKYTISLLNGGYIREIKDKNDQLIYTYADGDELISTSLVHEDDKIWIETPATMIADGVVHNFKDWNYVVGSTDNPLVLSRRNPRFTMGKGNLVMQPNYETLSVPGRGSVSFDYSPKNGLAALDLSADGLMLGLSDLTVNRADEEALNNNADVKYTVKFSRYTPTATESNAAKAQFGSGGDYARTPWILDLSLTRQVGGSNAPLPQVSSGHQPAPEVNVYAEIDRSVQDYADYRLFRVDGLDLDGNPSLTEVTMNPVEDGNGGFTGMITFHARAGEAYLMSYLKAYKVTIRDDKHMENNKTIYVEPGLPINEAEGYNGLNRDDYSDMNETVFEFKGFTLTNGTQNYYDDGQPITKNLTLYAAYQRADDTEWLIARDRLSSLLNEANGVKSGLPEGEVKEGLNQAILLANEDINRIPRAAKEILDGHFDTLTELLLAIGSGGQTGGGEPGGAGQPGGGGNQGGGSHSGGGSGSAGSGSHNGGGKGKGGSIGSSGTRALGPSNYFGGYKTYFAGVEGQWEKTGADWQFVLKDKSLARKAWVNVTYDDARHTCTYHFNKDGVMAHGWYQDAGGDWYYLNESNGADYGRLVLGWNYDSGTQKWYFFNQLNGIMATGWQQLGNDWYYFSPASREGQPFGSLLTDGKTPDGYSVDENGRWIRELP